MFLYSTLRHAAPHAVRLLSFFAVLCPSLSAQSPAEEKPAPVLFQTLSIGEPVSGLFYDLRGKAVPIQAYNSELSDLYETPVDRTVLIYRLMPAPTPEQPPQKQPVAKLHLSKNHPHLILMKMAANGGGLVVPNLEDSWTLHPEGTFRIINTSKRAIAVQLGAEQVTIASGGTHTFLSAGKGYDFDFKTASQEGDGWILRVQSPQAILPRTRATIIVSDPPPTPRDPNPRD